MDHINFDELVNNLSEHEARTLLKKLMAKFGDNVAANVDSETFNATVERLKAIEEKALAKLSAQKSINNICCSFCQKPSTQVERLISSEFEKVFICNVCIVECYQLI